MKNKLLGLLAILLGILVIPFAAKAKNVPEEYRLSANGMLTIVKNGTSTDESKNINDTFTNQNDLKAAFENAKKEILKWAKDLGAREDDYQFNVSLYKKYIKMDGTNEMPVSENEEYDKIINYGSAYLHGTVDGKKIVDKIEVNGATLTFKVGDKPVFTGVVGNKDLYSFDEEYWLEEVPSDAPGMGYTNYVSSNEVYNEEAKDRNTFIEKFIDGRRYFYGFNIKLNDSAKETYKFGKSTKIYINGKELKRPANAYTETDRIYMYEAYLLDFASKTVEEKNNAIVTIEANRIVGTATGDVHPGISDELAAIIAEALQQEKEITTKLEISKVSDEDKKAINEKIKDKVTSDMNIVSYMDISIPVIIDGEKKGYVTELNNNVPVTVNAPENLPKLKDGYTRTYAVVRLHDGEVAVLPVTVNEDGTLTFETDKFSEYMLTYTDTPVNPNTSDNILVSFGLAIISVVGLILIRKLRNN